MKRFASVLLSVIGAAAYQFDNATGPTYPVVIPLPQNLTYGSDYLPLNTLTPSFDFPVSYHEGHRKFVMGAVKDFINGDIYFNGPPKGSASTPLTLVLKQALPIDGDLLPPALQDTDESYNLTIDASGISLHCNQFSGLMRGLTTLSQLISWNATTYQVRFSPITVTDRPRYPYRGFMLDTSRHFYSLDSILQLIDAMAVAKFNVFHWHIVDDDSFPLELKQSFPNLTFNGAFTAEEVYTQSMVR